MTNQQFSLMFFGGAFVVLLVAMVLGGGSSKSTHSARADKPDATAAMTACQKSLKALASHPSTVNFHWTGNSQTQQGDGWLIKWSFSAKNSYGLEADMVGLCAVDASNTVLWADAQEAR